MPPLKEKESPSGLYDCVSFGDDDGSVADESDSEYLIKPVGKNVVALLAVLSFFTLNGARPGIFIAPYLLSNSWSERDIGIVLFLGGITTLLVQAPVGQLIDMIRYKKGFLIMANILIGVTSIVFSFNTTLAAVVICVVIQVMNFEIVLSNKESTYIFMSLTI